jgi:hypothetical protein
MPVTTKIPHTVRWAHINIMAKHSSPLGLNQQHFLYYDFEVACFEPHANWAGTSSQNLELINYIRPPRWSSG